MNGMALEYKRRDISVDDYYRMADAGIFTPEERVELVDGELIEVAPPELRHWDRHATINEYLVTMLSGLAIVVPFRSVAATNRNRISPYWLGSVTKHAGPRRRWTRSLPSSKLPICRQRSIEVGNCACTARSA